MYFLLKMGIFHWYVSLPEGLSPLPGCWPSPPAWHEQFLYIGDPYLNLHEATVTHPGRYWTTQDLSEVQRVSVSTLTFKWSVFSNTFRLQGLKRFEDILVGGFFPPIWKICSSNWIISSGRGENKKYLKPPPSIYMVSTNLYDNWIIYWMGSSFLLLCDRFPFCIIYPQHPLFLQWIADFLISRATKTSTDPHGGLKDLQIQVPLQQDW